LGAARLQEGKWCAERRSMVATVDSMPLALLLLAVASKELWTSGLSVWEAGLRQDRRDALPRGDQRVAWQTR